MYTRYASINEAYRVDNRTIEATAIATASIAGTLLAVAAINVVDNYITGGFVALAIAIFVSLGSMAATTTIIRWMFVRNAVSNSNLERNNGDAIFKALATSTAICFGIAAASLTLQIFEVNLATETTTAYFQLKHIAVVVASLVVDFTNVS